MANVFKLQLDIQSKSNFAHKVEPKLNIVRLLLLFVCTSGKFLSC